MKRFLSITFLLLLVTPAVITFSWFQYKKAILSHEVKNMLIAGIERNELTLLTFSKAGSERELTWEHAKEFEYKKQMYDVVDSKIVGDTIYFWCWQDNAETLLNNEFAAIIERTFQQDPQEKEKQEKLVSFYQSLYCTEPFGWNTMSLNFTDTIPMYVVISFSSFFSRPPSPPPKYSC